MAITISGGIRIAPATSDGFELGVTEPLYFREGGLASDAGPFAAPLAASTDVGIAGVRPGVSRSNYSGTISWTSPQLIQNLNLTGAAADSLRLMTGSDHIIRNCFIPGLDTASTPTGGGGVIQCNDASCSNLTFEYLTITPTYPNDRWDGVYGHDFTAYRCLIEHTVDAFGIVNQYNAAANVNIRGCWAGNLSWYNDDRGAHSNGTHNDFLQHHSSANVLVEGCTLWGYKWNALNPTNDAGGTTPLAFDSGWSSNRNPQAGQGILESNVAYFHNDNVEYRNLWLYGWEHPIKVTAYCGVSGHGGVRYSPNASVHDIVYMNDDHVNFGGAYEFYPLRTDGADVVFNSTGGSWSSTPTTVPSAWNIKWANRSSADRKQNVAVARRGVSVFVRV